MSAPKVTWVVAAGALGVGLSMFAMGTTGMRRRTMVSAEFIAMTRLPVTAWVWIAVALTVPLWAWSAQRLPIFRGRWLLSVLAHGALSLGIAYLSTALVWIGHQGHLALPPVNLQGVASWSLPFWMAIASCHLIEAWRRARARELETANLRARLAESRHQLLAAKLHPHFLFNTLQGISTLLHRDPEAADRLLGSLSELLREFLAREPRAEHSLGEELQLLDRYMDICAQRIGKRLSFQKQLDDAVEGLAVPTLILQPLAENAIEHGLARRAGPGTVTVFAARDGETLCFGIADDGPGLSNGKASEGLGLSNTRERLRELYGDRVELELLPVEPTGLRVQMRIPAHVSGNEAPA